jgi:hypothetical protein
MESSKTSKALMGKKIKIMSSADPDYLVTLVNCFCEVFPVIDIKYSVCGGIHHAMIIYREL